MHNIRKIILWHHTDTTANLAHAKSTNAMHLHIWMRYMHASWASAPADGSTSNKEKSFLSPITKHVLNVDNWLRVWDCALDRGCAGTIAVQNVLRFLSKPIFVDRTCQECLWTLIYNLTLHIFNSGKMCRVGLCTELFYAIIPTLFPCFLLTLFLHLAIFLESC